MTPQAVQPPKPAERLLVLSEEEFGEAVATRSVARPDVDNPLLRSRLVVQRAGADSGESERTVTLRKLLLETVEAINALPERRQVLPGDLSHLCAACADAGAGRRAAQRAVQQLPPASEKWDGDGHDAFVAARGGWLT